MRPDISQRGFALVEALAALAIVAVVMGLVFQTMAQASDASRRMSGQRRAILVAQSALALATMPEGETTAAVKGQADGFIWSIQISPYADDVRDGGWPLEKVSVAVTEPGSLRPAVRLSTLRLVK